MNKYATYILLFCGVATLLMGCDKTIHEYPTSGTSVISIELNTDRTPPRYYKELVYDQNGEYTETTLVSDLAETYTPNERLSMRIVTELYKMKSSEDRIDKGEFVARREVAVDRLMEAPQDTLQFAVPEGFYRVLTWADYTLINDIKDWHFDTSSLDAVQVNIEHKPRDNNHKSSAAGFCNFSVDFNHSASGTPTILNGTRTDLAVDNVIPVHLKRASGRFRLWATDLQDFLNSGNSIDDLRLKIVYKQYVSAGYNVDTETPNKFVQIYTMEAVPSMEPRDGVVMLFYDYVLTSKDKEDHVLIDLFIYDGDKELNHYQNISIPLRRNMETVVKGPFLTKKIGSGDIGIDDDFDDEFVVVVPD